MCNISVAPDKKIYQIPTEIEIQDSFVKIEKKARVCRENNQKIVVVQGLGFVGAAAAAVIAAAKNLAGKPFYYVIGLDLPLPNSFWKVARINEGLTPIESPDEELRDLIHTAVHKNHNLCATASEKAYSLADIIVVDVHLDVRERLVKSTEDIDIDLESFKNAIRTIARNMRSDALVLIETTVPVGTCEKIVLPILQEERKLRNIEEPVSLAHAYERVMPGPNYVKSIRNYWRTFSGINDASAKKAKDFLSSFINTESYPLKELGDTLSSEMGKVLENSYRAANIAFIHEWTLLAEKIGVNLFSVIESIRVRKGTHDNIRYPGFGVGGYCLTKDSLLAQWSATHLFKSDVVLKMTMEALSINYHMPLHTYDLLKELFEDNLRGKTIAVLGVSYLPEVADTRNSPTELLIDKLNEAETTVLVHDPYVVNWFERPDITVSQNLHKCLNNVDGIIFAVPHKIYCDLSAEKLLNYCSSKICVVDTQNIISDEKAAILHKASCKLLGVGKGHWRKRGYQW